MGDRECLGADCHVLSASLTKNANISHRFNIFLNHLTNIFHYRANPKKCLKKKQVLKVAQVYILSKDSEEKGKFEGVPTILN